MLHDDRKRSFDRVADQYRAHRPGYPDALADDIARVAGLPPAGRILEIGSGPGTASRPFIERGHRLLGLDLGPALVALARAEFAAYPGARFLVADFETWAPAEGDFDLVLSASSFHWLDPATRLNRIADRLRPGGSLAVLYNEKDGRDDPFSADLRELTRRHDGDADPHPPAGKTIGDDEPGLERFGPPTRVVRPFSIAYDAESFVALLGTYSGRILMPEERRRALFDDIRDLINRRHGGRIVRPFEAAAEIRRRIDGPPTRA